MPTPARRKFRRCRPGQTVCGQFRTRPSWPATVSPNKPDPERSVRNMTYYFTTFLLRCFGFGNLSSVNLMVSNQNCADPPDGKEVREELALVWRWLTRQT